MVTLVLGQTLVFWSGIAAGIAFVFLMATCAYNLSCANGICRPKTRERLFKYHKYFVWISVIFIAIHIMLALLSSVFHIWL